MVNGLYRGLTKLLYLVSVFVTAHLLYVISRSHFRHNIKTQQEKKIFEPKCETFACALEARSSASKFIVLIATDSAFTDMAINFYDTSLQPHGIENFLFVGIGIYTCRSLQKSKASLPCHQYSTVDQSTTKSVYGSGAFVKKMLSRIDMLLEALGDGYTVLLTDVDLYFRRNPLFDLENAVNNSDMGAMWDMSVYNAGFTVTKPTQKSIDIWNTTKYLVLEKKQRDDQFALNRAIRSAGVSFNVVKIDPVRYACGQLYFNKFELWLLDSQATSDATWVIHNNWIVSYEAKVYRFREHLMWTIDTGDYYSSSTRLYMSYDNPLMTSWTTSKNSDELYAQQLEALKVALAIGQIIKRVVILPRFHCRTSTKFYQCPLNSMIEIRSFDSQFASSYRESSFLRNDKVPKSTSGSVTSRIDLVASKPNVTVITSDTLLKRLSPVVERVLSLGMLYNARVDFQSTILDYSFKSAVQEGFIRTDYSQLSAMH